MPRAARKKSGTDIYHVILRGINRQQIFYDDDDYRYFISLLDRFRDVSHYDLYAYVLMGNHIHLLIKTQGEPLDTVFRRIGASFVYWYNMKYERTGHLFQDRFKSEPVESDAYFLTVLRYILRNPVKAGICDRADRFPYSSIHRLLGQSKHGLPCPLTVRELAEYIAQDSRDTCMEISDMPRRGMPDAAAKELILREFGASIPAVNGENREAVMRSIRRLADCGPSIRQISRLTGIPKSIVERALRP